MITSTGNDKIKNVIKCVKQSKERRKQGVFVVEGIRMFSEIPKDYHVESFVTGEFYDKHAELFAGLKYEIVSDNVMETLADTKTPQGVISIVRQFSYNIVERILEGNSIKTTDAEVSGTDNPLLIALENIQDPGNLGTIIRTCEGAGVTGILMSTGTVDIYNPKVVRATMGSIFRVPFAYVDDLIGCVKNLGENGFATYSAHLQGTSFYDFDYRKPTLFVMGNEGNGLSDEMTAVTKDKILIPMKGKVESLNVATASTVLMYEAMRQRSY
ncbi:MAG: RNA methyltransferase [Lachnospiraceae bacterium]|nr:RNA methyltransferase [Lachnospiraceae bacterium]